MSDAASSGLAPGPHQDGRRTLTPEGIEALLDEFRAWIQEAATRGEADTAPPEESPIDLHTLLGQQAALRQEVNLQTRASRNLQEQNAQTLEQLSNALQELTRKGEDLKQQASQAMDEVLRPLLKTLVDVYDALALGGREVRRVQETLRQTLESDEDEVEETKEESRENDAPAASPNTKVRPGEVARKTGLPTESPESLLSLAKPPSPSFWGRLLGLDRTAGWLHQSLTILGRTLAARIDPPLAISVTEAPIAEVSLPPPPPPPPTPPPLPVDRILQSLDSVVVGYTMSLQRLERTLRQSGLEPIETVGETYDPERMEVMDVSLTDDYPPNEVLEEVRRGYLWRGRLFRCAQVRVAKPSSKP